ncbi:MAG: PQQ-binding-like beta-propeller repeat protein [Armatimonadetes bacterium]|nr:PQQ-binding-like beta-propeller repeat protein [Armatimonadota bacterium]
MIAVIADQVKAFRHQLGKHVLFVGSQAVLQPYEATVESMLERMAMESVGKQVADEPPDRRAKAALEVFAETYPDGAERAARFSAMLSDLRPGEGHVQLARLIKDGYVPLLFTMSPDDALEKALSAQRLTAGEDYHLVVAGADAPDAIEIAVRESTRVVVVKCGGDVAKRVLPLTADEIRAALQPLRDLIKHVFRRTVIFTAYGDRDRPFLEFVPPDGDKVYWVNLHIPVADPSVLDEMRLESPDAEQYHKLQPEVLTLLKARNSEKHLLCREQGRFTEFFGRLYERLRRRRRSARFVARRSLSVRSGGPFKFLEAFDVHDADFFYGREQETQALFELVRDHPLVTLFGPLAVGKTSLLRAGLIPRLRKASEEADGQEELPYLPVYAACGVGPVQEVLAGLAAQTEEVGFDPTSVAEAASVPEAVRRVRGLTNHRPVLLCDSVHEVFVKLSSKAREELVGQIAQVCETAEETGARVVLSLREDYLAELYEITDALPDVFHHMLRLRKFTREQAEEAIEKPAANFGLQFDKELVEQMLEDLDREGILPAHLQIVCHGLLELAGPTRRYIGPMLYQRLNGARKYLDAYISRMLSQLSGGDRRLAWQILQKLATASETLASVPAEELMASIGAARPAFERVLARLDDMRFIRTYHRNGERKVELIHDLLAEDIRAAMVKGQAPTAQSAHDILARGLDNFRVTGHLLERGQMHRVDDERESLSLSAQELELAIRSAVSEGINADYWLGLLNQLGPARYGVLGDMLASEDARVRSLGLKHADKHLGLELLPPLVAIAEGQGEEAEQAAELLKSMRNEIVAALRSEDTDQRRWAARALALIGGKYLRELAAALDDQHPGAVEAIADALSELDLRRSARLLLSSLQGSNPQWAAAEALGRMGQDAAVLALLRRGTARRPDSPHLAFALGVALMRQRRYEEAAEVLETSVRLAENQGMDADVPRQALQRCRSVLAIAQRGEDRWSMAGGSPAHSHFVAETLQPPLAEFWTAELEGDVVGHVLAARGLIFACLRKGTVVALDSATGAQVWRQNVGGRVEVSAALAGDTLLVPTVDSRLVGLSLSGDHVFSARLSQAPRSALSVYEKLVFFGDRSGAVSVFDLDAQRCEVLHHFGEEVTAAVSVAQGLAYAASWDATVVAIKLEDRGLAWTWRGDEPVPGAVAVDDSAAVWVCGNGTVICAEPATGKVIWQARVTGGSRAAPTLTPRHVLVPMLDGHVRVLDRSDGTELFALETADQVLSAPLALGDIAYVAGRDGSLYAFSLEDGEQLWRYATSYGIYATPSLVGSTLLVPMRQRQVVAFVPQEEAE